MPSVSVIIPTYNRPAYLKRALESVLSQTFKDWEVIVVGRESESGPLNREIVRDFQEKGMPVRSIQHPQPGPSAPRNIGIRESTGEWIAFLDDDDLWRPEKLMIQTDFLKSHPEVGMVYGRVQILRLMNGTWSEGAVYPPRLAATFEEIINESCWITSSTVMIRRGCLEQLNGFDTRYEIGEDWDLWLRFSKRWKIAGLSEVLTLAPDDGHESLSKDKIKSHLQGINVLRNLRFEEEYKKYRPLIARHMARLNYRLAQEYGEASKFRLAARHFIVSLTLNPLVGLMVRRPEEVGLRLIARIAKSYLAVPASIAKGLIHD